MIDRKKILNEIEIISNNFQSKKYLETISKSKKLLHSLPNNEFLNNMIGLSYLNIGNIEDAKNLYLRITKSAPSIISYQNNYANVLKAQNKFDEAENILEKILDRNPDYLNALNNLANLKKTLGKNEEAIKLFEKALKVEPKNSIILYNIALCYRSLRNYEQVKLYALKIIDIDPNFTLADQIISQIQDYRKDDLNHYELMKKKLFSNEINDHNRAILFFSLAKANEDRGNYEEAFKFFTKGNDLIKKENTYNLNLDIQEFNKIKKYFSSINLLNLKIKNLDKKIIFICGMPRSGTTLVEQIVSAHSKVRALGETDQLQEIINNSLDNFNFSFDNHFINNSPSHSFIYDKYVEFIDKIDNKKLIFTDKSLFNFKLIGFIKMFLPNSKIIVLKRDINNNLLSIYKNNLISKNLAWTYDINQILAYYRLFEDYINFWSKNIKDSFLEINYSDLITNTVNTTKKIIKHCDLEWENNCLKYHEVNKSAIDTASVNQANKPIYNSSLNKFENYKKFFNLK